jgi:hypothetical protein
MKSLFTLVLALCLSLGHHAWAATNALAEPQPLAIWNQLAGESSTNKPSSAEKRDKKITGTQIQIAGFITANEFNEGEISEFLLARYPGGCIHVPLPPPSSMIHVTMAKGKTTPIFFGKRVVVEGVIQDGGRVDASYEMTATSVKEFPW